MSLQQFEMKDLDEKLEGHIDVLICSVSYERRCRSVADNIDPKRIKHALIAENKNHREFHGDNAEYLCDRFSPSFKHVMLDRSDPLKTADELQAALESCIGTESKRIVVDITTFTRESLLILFMLLQERFAQTNVRYVYARARDYDPGVPEEKKWLSKGVGEVRSVLGYPGELLPSRKLHFIILAGREHERAAELIRSYEPSVVSLGCAARTEHDRDPGKSGFQQVKAVFSTASQFTFDCLDPLRTKAAIADQVALRQDFNVIIAPLHTKLSTLGAGLTALENPKLQLCYAQPIIYNYENYSRPGDQFFLFQIDDA
jgi:hypothetical protein